MKTAQALREFEREKMAPKLVDLASEAPATAYAEVTRLGGRIASTQMRLHNDAGVLIATAAAAYSVS